MTVTSRPNQSHLERSPERVHDAASISETGFHRQLAYLLSQPESKDAFKARQNPCKLDQLPNCEIDMSSGKDSKICLGEAAQCAEDPQVLDGMNADTDQVAQMLNLNPIAELFDALKERDRSQALDFATQHSEVQTHALHDGGDESFQMELRVRLGAAA